MTIDPEKVQIGDVFELNHEIRLVAVSARESKGNSELKEETSDDGIKNPPHYCEGRKFEPKDVIRDWSLNFNLGNTVKYISRNGRKDGEPKIRDLRKARQYLDFEIEALEREGAL